MGVETVEAEADGEADKAVLLQEQWSAASVRRGWSLPQDWWVPAVDAVTEALLAEADPGAACEQLGRARASEGVGVEETINDLFALYEVLGAAEPPGTLLRGLVVGWVDAWGTPIDGCEDPLTKLATPAYLRTRLAEVYREASRAGRSASDSHAFVVVGLEHPELGWERMTRTLLVAECLAATFSGGETHCAAGPLHVVTLAARDDALSPRVAVLRDLLAEELGPGRPVRVWVEGLPRQPLAAYQQLLEYAR